MRTIDWSPHSFIDQCEKDYWIRAKLFEGQEGRGAVRTFV